MNTGVRTNIPAYRQLSESLKRRIDAVKLSPGSLLDTEHALAKREGVSRVTVRKASDLLIAEGLIERRAGKGLFICETRQSVFRIQVIAGRLDWAPALEASRGVQMVGRERGVEVGLYDAHGDIEKDIEWIRRLPENDCDGAVIISLHHPALSEVCYHLNAARFPFVLIDQTLKDIQASSVLADNYRGGWALAEHLIALGHRELGFVGDLEADTVRDRLGGFRDAAAEHSIAIRKSRIIDVMPSADRLGDWSERVDQCTRALMRPDQGVPPTAIFYSCDGLAKAGCRTLREMGLSIPGDVSVVGFDDDPIAEWLDPPLTTIRQPFQSMGQFAAESLIDQLVDKGSAAVGNAHVLPVELIVRASTSRLVSKASSSRP